MPASLWFYLAMVAFASVGTARLARDAILRRRLASVTPSLTPNDQAWIDTLARGATNDREIIAGYRQDALALRERDVGEAARRLMFAREQVEQAALPDARDALESLVRVWRELPAVPHLGSWPGGSLRSPWCRVVSAAAGIASALALTSRGRVRVRLWLIGQVVRHAARSFLRNAVAPSEHAFDRVRHPRLQAAAHDLGSGQVALLALAEELLLARAGWALLGTRQP